MSRPEIEPTTSYTTGVHSSKELSRQHKMLPIISLQMYLSYRLCGCPSDSSVSPEGSARLYLARKIIYGCYFAALFFMFSVW
jgi:hypothetical protein